MTASNVQDADLLTHAPNGLTMLSTSLFHHMNHETSSVKTCLHISSFQNISVHNGTQQKNRIHCPTTALYDATKSTVHLITFLSW